MRDDVYGADTERKEWTPTSKQLARYAKREAELARHNIAVLELAEGPRRVDAITNGKPEYGGYHAIGVHRGGANWEDTLHSLSSFGAGRRPRVGVSPDVFARFLTMRTQ